MPVLESLFVGANAFEGERRWYENNEVYIAGVRRREK